MGMVVPVIWKEVYESWRQEYELVLPYLNDHKWFLDYLQLLETSTE